MHIKTNTHSLCFSHKHNFIVQGGVLPSPSCGTVPVVTLIISVVPLPNSLAPNTVTSYDVLLIKCVKVNCRNFLIATETSVVPLEFDMVTKYVTGPLQIPAASSHLTVIVSLVVLVFLKLLTVKIIKSFLLFVCTILYLL